MPDAARCPQCDALLPADSVEGLCPNCLLRLAMATEPEAADTLAIADGAETAVEHQFGAYQIVRLLGEGGMGTVYLAEQRQPIRRLVALKVIKLGMSTREVMARFDSERQALALMDHPHIARVFDAGASEQGRPYFVMEYVSGIPITEYCDRHRLNNRERMELFMAVCQAVHHAHQKGIIHRDIKPSNVLVAEQDGKPVPKVIDFGIAKAIDQRVMERATFTQMGNLVGTPEYMSPEQTLLTPNIDTTTDVYSLGVLLYELLAGALPFERKQLREAGLAELLRIIREENPPTPSDKVSKLEDPAEVAQRRRSNPDLLRRQLTGDLNWIVMKALEKERRRRYASVSELAADLRRHLENHAVLAGPPSRLYRARKFVRRHRLAVSAGVLVAASLIGGAGVATWQAEVARSQRARADVKAYEADRQARQTEAQRQLATEQWRRAEEQTKVAEQQRRRAEAQRQLATQQWRRADEQTKLAEQQQREATAERNRAVAAETQAVQQRNRAVAEKQRADTEAATAMAVNNFLRNDLLAQAGADTQARPDTKPDPDLKVRTALDRAAASIAGRFNTQPLVEASIRQTIGNAYNELGLYPDAQRHLERALTLRQRILGENDPSTLSTMYDLANDLYRYQGKYAQAEPLFIKVLEVRRRVLGEEHPWTLETMNRLGDLYRYQRKFAEAESLLSKALAGCRRVLGEEHPWTLDTMNNLALVYQWQGKYAQAEPLFSKALEGCRSGLGEEHPETLIVSNNLAVLYRNERRYAEAEPLFINVLEVRRRVLGEEHLDTRDTMNDLALLYLMQGKYASAEPLLTRLVEMNRRMLGEEHPRTLETMNNLAVLYRNERRYAEAEPLFINVLEIRRRVLGEEHPNALLSMNNLGLLYLRQGRYTLAGELYIKVLEVRRRVLGPQHPDTLTTMNNLALLYLGEGKYNQAEALLRETLTSYEKTTPNAWSRYQSQSLLGASLAGQRRYGEAEALVVSGYEGMLQREAAIPGESRPNLERAAAWIVQLYEDWGKPEKAAVWTQKLREAGLSLSPKKP
jgi:eukaryotic-like serine/threonine-protein kinase